jgi:hypothetical protein
MNIKAMVMGALLLKMLRNSVLFIVPKESKAATEARAITSGEKRSLISAKKTRTKRVNTIKIGVIVIIEILLK